MEAAPVRRGHDERQQEAYIGNADRVLATVEDRDRTYARKARIAASRIEDAARRIVGEINKGSRSAGQVLNLEGLGGSTSFHGFEKGPTPRSIR